MLEVEEETTKYLKCTLWGQCISEPNSAPVYLIEQEFLQNNWKLWSAGDNTGKVRKTPKLMRLIILGTMTTGTKFHSNLSYSRLNVSLKYKNVSFFVMLEEQSGGYQHHWDLSSIQVFNSIQVLSVWSFWYLQTDYYTLTHASHLLPWSLLCKVTGRWSKQLPGKQM